MEEEALKTITFKGGFMNYNEETKLVSADKRKGKIVVQKLGEMTRFSWQDEQGNEQEDKECYVMPNGGKLELSKQRDRVFILFNNDDPQNPEPIAFYWIQEKNKNNDQKLVQDINELINEIIDEEDYEDIQDEQENLLPQGNQPQSQNNNIFQQDIMQQLYQQMQGQNQQQGGNQPNFNLLQQMLQRQQKKEAPTLRQVFTKEYLEEISKDEDFKNALIGELPDCQKTEQGLIENLKSPQFQQALASLDKALNSEDGQSVLLSLGFSAEGFQNTIDGNKALYDALEKYAQDQKK